MHGPQFLTPTAPYPGVGVGGWGSLSGFRVTPVGGQPRPPSPPGPYENPQHATILPRSRIKAQREQPPTATGRQLGGGTPRGPSSDLATPQGSSSLTPGVLQGHLHHLDRGREKRMSNELESYFKPSMLEDPWAGLEPASVVASNQQYSNTQTNEDPLANLFEIHPEVSCDRNILDKSFTWVIELNPKMETE
uniref:Uncharacterized protein n=1 Tax=Lynx canadensis TaxID=61383 RepID=A0A667FYQ7_LYNCA